MNKLSGMYIVGSAIRGCICASAATAITAFFSWSFVASTNTLTWPGSAAVLAHVQASSVEGSPGFLAVLA